MTWLTHRYELLWDKYGTQAGGPLAVAGSGQRAVWGPSDARRVVVEWRIHAASDGPWIDVLEFGLRRCTARGELDSRSLRASSEIGDSSSMWSERTAPASPNIYGGLDGVKARSARPRSRALTWNLPAGPPQNR